MQTKKNYRKNYKTELKNMKANGKKKALLTKKTIPEVLDHCFMNYKNSVDDNETTFVYSTSYFWFVKAFLQIRKIDFTDNNRDTIFIKNVEFIDEKYGREFTTFTRLWSDDSLPGVIGGIFTKYELNEVV